MGALVLIRTDFETLRKNLSIAYNAYFAGAQGKEVVPMVEAAEQALYDYLQEYPYDELAPPPDDCA